MEDLEQYVTTNGPFDAVLAFSQGSVLASAFILHQQTRSQYPFKCAVFIAGASLTDEPSLESDTNTEGCLWKDGDRIGLPTLHIWGEGEEDHTKPLSLMDLC